MKKSATNTHPRQAEGNDPAAETGDLQGEYKELCDSAYDLIDILSAEGKVLYANATWRQTLGYTPAEVAGLFLWDVVHPEDLPQAREGIRRLLSGEPPNRFEVRFRRKDGSAVYLEGTVNCRRTPGKPVLIRGILREIGERKRAEQLLREMHESLQDALRREQEIARIDPLTHVANRRAFYELGAAELRRARRYRRALTFVCIDLDNFKRLNDTLGHITGDAVLVSVAGTLRSELRGTDIVARMGGDEFAVILPETDVESARIVLDKLHSGLLETIGSNHWDVTFSIGAASFLVPPASLEEALRMADDTMYSVKNQGKNGVSVALIG
jgi:diguanylate cyclase (GGDEF)-like protein/PAS domain S-box-containing protein